MKDPIREYLKRKGAPTHVVEGGLSGLIETWETVAIEVSHGYDLTLDDYLNDMDGRQLIEEVVPLATTPAHKALLKKLNRIDAMMRTLVRPSSTSIWGDEVAAERGWSPDKQWWYFSYPKNPGPDLRDAIDQSNNQLI